MILKHAISIHQDGLEDELRAVGVVLKKGSRAAFDVAESDPAWPGVQAILARFPDETVLDFAYGVFERAEIESAAWLQLQATRHRGYPRFTATRSFHELPVFDTQRFCSSCGIGLQQAEPLQLTLTSAEKRALAAGGFFQPSWIFDAWLATTATYQDTLSSWVPAWEVRDSRGDVRPDVVQLHVTETAPEPLVGIGEPMLCPACGQAKFPPPAPGWAPSFRGPPPTAGVPSLVLSQEWFGSGANAFRLTYVNAAGRRDIERAKAVGDLRLVPCQPKSPEGLSSRDVSAH